MNEDETFTVTITGEAGSVECNSTFVGDPFYIFEAMPCVMADFIKGNAKDANAVTYLADEFCKAFMAYIERDKEENQHE